MNGRSPSLPLGWAWTTLGEVSTLGPKPERNKLSPNMQVSFVPMRSVEPLSGRINLAETKPASEVMRGYTYFEDGDVLSAKVTPCMENGKVAIARGLKNGIGFGSTEFHVIRPSPGLAPEYMFFYLVQESVRREAKRSMGGAVGLLRVPASFIEGLQLPLPSSSEQRRIVAKIEEVFSQLDAGVEELKKAKAQLKRYRQSVLKAAFQGKLTEAWRRQRANSHKPIESAKELLERIKTERKKALGSKYKDPPPLGTSELPVLPDDWSWATLGEVVDSVPLTGRKLPQSEYLVSGPFPVVDQGQQLVGGYTDREELRIRVQRPAIVFGDHTKAIKYVDFDFVAGADGIKPLVPWEVFFPKLFYYCLLALPLPNKGYARHFQYLAKSSIPVPPMPEQHQIVAEVEQRLSVADAEEKAIEAALKQAARLRQSILKRAFEGRLVPQDPTDLPAPRPGHCFIYALECSDGSHYIGQTEDVERRWCEHAGGRGADWTKTHPPVALVHWEEFESRERAVEREQWLKTGFGRKWLKRELAAGRTRRAGEPASILLERIRAEKAKREAGQSRGRGRRTATARK